MEIKITEVMLTSFCNIKDRVVKLYDRTIVKGVNKIGKTTLVNAIYWILFNKLIDGTNADDSIRKHDENGVVENFTDVSASLTADFGDKEVTITKIQKQNWVKDRTTQEQKFKGNVNEYDINGIPKKDFKEYLSQFVDIDKFLFCINPRMFFNLDTKKRRAMLFSLVGDFTDNDVIAKFPKFEKLKTELMDGTVDELISRSKKAIKVLTENLNLIPARIDEITHQMVEVDESALNKRKTELKALLDAEHDRIKDLDVASKDFVEIATRITEVKTAMSLMEQNAKNDYDAKLKDIDRQIFDISSKSEHIKRIISSADSLKADYEIHKKRAEEQIQNLRNEWNKENSTMFDEESLKCPVCGAKFGKTKADKLKEEFKNHKIKTLGDIERMADDCKKQISDRDAKINELLEEIKANEAIVEENKKQIETLENEQENLVMTDVTKDKDYKALSKKLATLQKKYETKPDDAEQRSLISNSIKELETQLTDVEIQLSAIQNNANIQRRIDELSAEQIETSQKIAKQEQMVDLLKEYQRTKVTMLTDKINEYFKVIKWQMFEEQINGDYADVCIPLVEGTSYDGLLNHGNKILAEIDLCEAFQKANGITCPIIIDDSESLDEWRIPETKSQLIILRRTDDKELTVERI